MELPPQLVGTLSSEEYAACISRFSTVMHARPVTHVFGDEGPIVPGFSALFGLFFLLNLLNEAGRVRTENTHTNKLK